MLEISVPNIDSIDVPEMVAINTKFLIQVFVSENIITIIPYELYSGDIFAGEV